MVFEHVIKFSEVKKSGPTVNFFSLPPKNQACNLLYVYGHMYIIITSRESRGRNGLAWERKKVGRGGTTRASSSCVWEEKRWQRGRASSSKTMSAGVLLLVFFFGLGNSDPHFLWVPGKAAQNLWNECKECIVWEPHRSVVNFISALASRARGVGKMQTPLSLSLILSPSNS